MRKDLSIHIDEDTGKSQPTSNSEHDGGNSQLIHASDPPPPHGLQPMVYTFGRVHAVLNMDIGDYFSLGTGRCVRLHEKNGKVITVPAHHLLVEALDAYVEVAGGVDASAGLALLRIGHASRTGQLETDASLGPAVAAKVSV